MESIRTNKKIIEKFCNENLHLHTDWTGTRVETIQKYDSLEPFIDKLVTYLKEEYEKR